MTENNKRVLLCIMDGWGLNKNCPKDAVSSAKTPNYDSLKQNEKYTEINASGEFVGLPDGQMGNSEVGHLNLGAGRVVYQDLTRINKSIREGQFFENKALNDAINHAKANDSALHLYGLVSTGGVHSSFDHIKALVKLAADKGLKKVFVHAFLDGRDTPPQSAQGFLAELETELKKHGLPQIATISGRYWAMDRDNRWERVEKAYNTLLLGEGESAKDSAEAIAASYAKEITDEFVEPTVTNADPDSRIKDNDAIIFFNYRPDRAREITRAVTFAEFDGFERKAVRKNLFYVCFTQYDETFPLEIAFPPEKLTNLLGDVLDANEIQQFRTAETEKYAHITFFFNGGEEKSGKLETRALVASPKVATYDLQPEMSAPEVCENVLKALADPQYGFILVNFANPDMVGHTGVFEAAVKACETVDECIGKIAQKAKENGVVMLLTADHGNAECMEDPESHTPFTAHTTNPVPFMLINGENAYELKETGALSDVAPTILQLLGVKQPQEMTGESLIG